MLIGLGCAALTFAANTLSAQTADSATGDVEGVVLLEARGKVAILRGGRRLPASPPQRLQAGDRLETGPKSEAALRWYDRLVFRTSELSVLEIPPVRVENKRPGLDIIKGIFYFFHRDKPKELELRTPTSLAVVLGTEFVVEVSAEGSTAISVLEGQVQLDNVDGQVVLESGMRGHSIAGQAPTSEPIVAVGQALQWFLYYPAVLDVEELDLERDGDAAFGGSVSAYRAGNLEAALNLYPETRQPATADESTYLAGLFLGVGQIGAAEALLDRLDEENEGARALRILLAAVEGGTAGEVTAPSGSSVALANSYLLQARGDLEGALRAARYAVGRSGDFGFGWARVAELEFAFGRIGRAGAALELALRHSPSHAEALTLRGFLLAARNRIAEAIAAFDEAIQSNGRFASPWLGRGLGRIRAGEGEAGLRDLQVAAAMEPRRSVLRSYLAKAWHVEGDSMHAARELELAKELDSGDPTPWLYSALILEENNRLNEAVENLERSQELNQNRRLYRSRLLLDQDQAVRGANLARIYDDAGMADVSFREAGRAVNLDYANYSAHLFLANSYDRLREPGLGNRRFDPAWLSEYLLANLLAPVGAGTLSQSVSQLEYSRLFERDRIGLVSRTTYASRGAWTTSGAQFGVLGNTAYSVEGVYTSDPGQWNNTDLETLTLAFQVKQQLTPSDSIFVRGAYYDAEGGDPIRHYSPSSVRADFRFEEEQEPVLLAGYHHEWRPGVHTLVLAGRLVADSRITDGSRAVVALRDDGTGTLTQAALRNTPGAIDFRSDLEIYTAEWQQLWKGGPHQIVAGARYQEGSFDAGNDINADAFFVPATSTNLDYAFRSLTAYGYYHWQAHETLQWIAGVAYDRMTYPSNHRFPPVTAGESEVDRISPKAGVIWTPGERTTLRAAYTRSLGGVSLERSYQLQPSQVAGFTQSYRSLIPESAVGDIAATEFQTWGAAFERRFGKGTYFGLSAELLESEAERDVGAFLRTPVDPQPIVTPQAVDYRERSVIATLNQLVGDEWAFGARYQFSEATAESRYTALLTVPAFGGFAAESQLKSTLQQLDVFALYHHASGFFSRAEGLWSVQKNHGSVPDEDFWQFNLYLGYRFARRRAEARLGLLNLTDQDYRLHPLNWTRQLPRERTLEARLSWYF